jgi:hypothetical protein
MVIIILGKQVVRALSKKDELTVKQNEIARTFSETLGAGRFVVNVGKPAAERAQDRQGLIDLGSL